MFENITQMRRRHDKEIAELQASCVHNGKRQWMPYSYSGPNHLNGDICLVCLVCGKELSRERLPGDWWARIDLTDSKTGITYFSMKLFDYIKEKNKAMGVK